MRDLPQYAKFVVGLRGGGAFKSKTNMIKICHIFIFGESEAQFSHKKHKCVKNFAHVEEIHGRFPE